MVTSISVALSHYMTHQHCSSTYRTAWELVAGSATGTSTIAQQSGVCAKKERHDGPEELKQPIIDTLEEASHGRATTALDESLDVNVAVPKCSDDQSFAENPWFVAGAKKCGGGCW